jgi:hypothetical protein
VVAVGGTSHTRIPLTWRGSLGESQAEVVRDWGPAGGAGGGPSLYEPRRQRGGSVQQLHGDRARPNLCNRILVLRSFRGFTDIASGTFTIGPYCEDLLATEVWDFFTGVGSSLGCFGK